MSWLRNGCLGIGDREYMGKGMLKLSSDAGNTLYPVKELGYLSKYICQTH